MPLACLALLSLALSAAPPCDVLAEFDIGTDEGPIIVPVTIAGRSYPFLLDTGATYSGYDRSLKHLMGKQTHTEKLLTPVGMVETAFALPPDARLGSLPLPRDKPAMVDDFDRFRAVFGRKLYGTIGMDFLAAHVVRIDFERGKLTILRRPPANAGHPLPCKIQHVPS